MLSCPSILDHQAHIQRVSEIKVSSLPPGLQGPTVSLCPRERPLPVLTSLGLSNGLESFGGTWRRMQAFPVFLIPNLPWGRSKKTTVAWGLVVLTPTVRWEMQNQIHACAALCCSFWNLLEFAVGRSCLQWHQTDFPGQSYILSLSPAFSALPTLNVW